MHKFQWTGWLRAPKLPSQGKQTFLAKCGGFGGLCSALSKCVLSTIPAAAVKKRRTWPRCPELDINWISRMTAGIRCRHGTRCFSLLAVTYISGHFTAWWGSTGVWVNDAQRHHEQQGETSVINYALTQRWRQSSPAAECGVRLFKDSPALESHRITAGWQWEARNTGDLINRWRVLSEIWMH